MNSIKKRDQLTSSSVIYLQNGLITMVGRNAIRTMYGHTIVQTKVPRELISNILLHIKSSSVHNLNQAKTTGVCA